MLHPHHQRIVKDSDTTEINLTLAPAKPPTANCPVRTYLYKLTSDRGGAPCAIEPPPGSEPLLTLAICKPAIRRTAQPGDRILGITSHSLAHSDGYPLGCVIYAAIVQEGVDARDYFDTPFAHRPDCIYEFHRQNWKAAHTGRSGLHRDVRHILKDLGHYPHYKNGRVLVAHDFRYFGAAAPRIPDRLHLLSVASETLGQGHRVFNETDPESREADALFRHLWKRPTAYTPAQVDSDAYDHTPRRRQSLTANTSCAPSCKNKGPDLNEEVRT